jgi:hypothetical protein
LKPAAAIICLAVFGASAQTQSGNPASRFTVDFLHDQKRIWTSPFHMDKKQFWTAAVPLVAGTAALIPADTHIVNSLPNSHAQITAGNWISGIGTGYSLGVGAGATAVAGYHSKSPAWQEMGRDASLALLDSAVVVTALKYTFLRERPNVPGSTGQFWHGGTSFPSAHAMLTFAVASAVAHNRKCPAWLRYTLYGSAAAVSVSRVLANKHWPSDVYFGGFTGFLIGGSVAANH